MSRAQPSTVQDALARVDELGRCRVARAAEPTSRRVELAYDERGRPFEISTVVKGWLVFRRAAGAAATWRPVTGREGRPLVLPADADAAELFVAVGGALGHYRLDPVDGAGAQAAREPRAFVEVVRPVRPLAG